MDIYAQAILERYKNPFHKGKSIEHNLSHSEANHSCGDKITIYLKTEEGDVDGSVFESEGCTIIIPNDKIVDYSFEGEGCAISMAAADMMGDLMEEMSLDEVLELKKENIYEMLGIEISVRRSKCGLLPLLSVQNGILAHQNKEKKGWMDYHV